jgi:peptide deformylase
VVFEPWVEPVSEDKVIMTEGCLSIPGEWFKVPRYPVVILHGKVDREDFSVGATGLFAQVCQHEVDHLNGILCASLHHDAAERVEAFEWLNRSIKAPHLIFP